MIPHPVTYIVDPGVPSTWLLLALLDLVSGIMVRQTKGDCFAACGFWGKAPCKYVQCRQYRMDSVVDGEGASCQLRNPLFGSFLTYRLGAGVCGAEGVVSDLGASPARN